MAAFTVLGIVPACGTHLVPPGDPRTTQFGVNCSDPINAGTVGAGDFTVDGIGANIVSVAGSGALFTFNTSPITWLGGPHVMAVAAGAFNRTSDGLGISAFSCNLFWSPGVLPNMIAVPTRDGFGNNQNVINSAILNLAATHWQVNWVEIPCTDVIGGDHILINAGMFGRHFIPEPFVSAGLQNPVVWGTFGFGPGYTDHPYQEQWFLENITQPVVFTLDFGDLPPGLVLSNIGNSAEGQISGIPTQSGQYTFTLRATGPDVTASKIFQIVITDDAPPPQQGSSFIYGN